MNEKNLWPELSKISRWTPLPEIGLEFSHVRDNLYCAAPHCYIIAADYDIGYIPSPVKRIVYLLWAESEGAALRAAHMDIEADQASIKVAIPSDMLLPGGFSTYGAIFDALESGKYGRATERVEFRIGKDGAFIHSVISTRDFEFYFRSRSPDINEAPYAIQNRLMSTRG